MHGVQETKNTLHSSQYDKVEVKGFTLVYTIKVSVITVGILHAGKF
jgi:hypothetical protein